MTTTQGGAKMNQYEEDEAMKKITLRLTGTGVWVATWSGPEASDIAALMGSDTIETPFLRGYDSEKMRREIEARNPGYVVEVAA